LDEPVWWTGSSKDVVGLELRRDPSGIGERGRSPANRPFARGHEPDCLHS
jgi:hypothetical protein